MKCRRFLRAIPALVAAAAVTGCGPLFDVDLFVMGEQTALEKQVLGTYGNLGEDLLIYSSVRGVEPDGSLRTPPPMTGSQQQTFAAMRNREYNRDDIQRFLTWEVVGEANDGLLAWRAAELRGQGGMTLEQIRQVVEEENTDRRTILDRLMMTTPGVESGDRSEVAWILAGLNQETAPAGAWIQNRDGEWVRK